MQQPPNPLRRKLAATRTRWRGVHLLSGLLWAVALALVLAMICYHWDSHLPLTTRGRELWRMLLPAALGFGIAVALLRAFLPRLPDLRLAADVERRYPVLQERLLTTLDLAPSLSALPAGSAPQSLSAAAFSSGSARIAPGFSPSLTAAVVQETQQVASGLDFRRAVSTRPLRIGGLALLLIAGFSALDAALAGPAFANWLHRMAEPGKDIPPYAMTRVQVLTHSSLLPVGASDWITVRTWGNEAEQTVLRIHREGEPVDQWHDIALAHPEAASAATREERNVRLFRYHLDHLTSPGTVRLYAKANDGRSNEREVTVAARPVLLDVKIRLTYPAYMHRAAKTLDLPNGSFAAPYGSEAALAATANNALRSAEFLPVKGTAQNWQVDGKQLFGHLKVTQDTGYTVRLTDTNRFDNPDLPHYVIHAEKDRAPDVEIKRPATDVDLVPDGSLPLIAHASDDYGVTEMRLVYSKSHLDESKAGADRFQRGGSGVLALPGPDGKPEVTVAQRWHLASVAPHTGDTLQYEVDAVDNDTLDGPHIGRSLAYRVHVVALTEMQQRLKEQLSEEQRSLQQLRQHQQQAQQQAMRAAMKHDTAAMTRAEETQRAAAQEAQSLQEKVQQLSNQLENNNLATPSELQRRQEAQQALQADAQQKMPSAAESIQKAQNSARAERSKALSQANGKQNEVRKDLDRAKQLLSRTPSAEQLAQEAARLAQQQQQLSDSSNALAEDLRSQHKESPGSPMTPEDKAGMQMERQQQTQTSADTQKLAEQLKQASKAAQERGDTAQAQGLKRAADALKQSDAAGQQRKAQRSLDKNDPQSASPAQDKAAQALQKAAQQAQQAMGQKPNDTPQSAAEKLEQAAHELRRMAEQQRGVAEQTQKQNSAAQNQGLAQKEQSLQQQANQAQQQLDGSKSAQQSVQNAQKSLQQSQQQLSQNQSKSAQSPAQRAAQQLEDAARKADRSAQQLKQQEAASELAGKVEQLAQVQHGLQSATKRLEKAKEGNHLSSNDMNERRQVGDRQADTQKQATDLVKQFPSRAFQKAMQMAAGQMDHASHNLNRDEPDTGSETQSAQSHAAHTLDIIARALKEQAHDGSAQDQKNKQSQQQQSSSQQQKQAAEALGEMMLAQGLQEQLRQDTGALDKIRQNHALTPPQQQQSEEMAQGERETRDITRRAGEQLQEMPDVAKAAQDAAGHMDRAGQRLTQRQTDQITQAHQDQALKSLDQAVQQLQQQQQYQQQQQQAQQQAQQGAPRPMAQKGGMPQKQAFTRLVGAQRGTMSAPVRKGKGLNNLSQRTQRILQEGRTDKVPAEYQDPVNRYNSSLTGK